MAQHGFGIIGCGMIAEFHTRAINEIENARVVAAWSRNRGQRGEDRRARRGGCRTYDDLDAMLAHPDLDVVCVCTPSGAHMEPAVQAARAGKHVVVEKPLEITLPRCDAIIEACDAAGVRLCTIFPSRFTPANLRLKEAIEMGRFGRLDARRHVREVVADPGVLRLRRLARHLGPRRRRRPHEPGDPQRRPALLADGRRRHRSRPSTATLAHERIEVEDTAVAALRFKNGALGRDRGGHERLSRPPQADRDPRRPRARPGSNKTTSRSGNFRKRCPATTRCIAAMAGQTGFKAGASDPRGITHIGHRDQLADFLEAIDEDRPPLVDGREGRKSVEIIRAIYRSAETGTVVTLPLASPGPGDASIVD